MDIIEVERALLKRYRSRLYSPFIRGLQTYEMLKEGDVVGVCISGGKDSLVLAKLLALLQRHSDFTFTVKFIAMDPGFTPENRLLLEENCRKLEIPLIIKDSNIYKVAKKLDNEKPCYMCARMRRGFLYRIAKEEGCNKIALAHHFDDVVETILLNIFYGGTFKTMMPKIKAKNYKNMELIRPLYLVKEKDIQQYIKYIQISPISCGCELTEKELPSKRKEVKKIISDLAKVNKNIPINIFRSAENVNLNTCLNWKYQDNYHHFLDSYQENDDEDE